MSVTERQRHQLLAWYEANMGPELAAIAMELTPPTAWGDLVTKRDLDQFGNELRSEMAQLRSELLGEFHGELSEVRGELRGEISELRGEIGELRGDVRGEISELRGEINGLHHKIDGEIGKLRAEMHQLSSRTTRTFIGLLLATQSAAVAIITLLQ